MVFGRFGHSFITLSSLKEWDAALFLDYGGKLLDRGGNSLFVGCLVKLSLTNLPTGRQIVVRVDLESVIVVLLSIVSYDMPIG